MKSRIKNKARELFLQYGVRSVSMDDIAGAVGSSKKTIYHHFRDKESLVDEVVVEMLALNSQCIENDGTKAENALQEAFLAIEHSAGIFKRMNPIVVYDLYKYHPSVFLKFSRFKNDFLLGVIRDNLRRGKEEGLYRKDLDINILANYRVHSLFIPFNPEFYDNMDFSMSDVQKELFYHFIFGIVTPRGYQLISEYLQT